MRRNFNVCGPCDSSKHYMLPLATQLAPLRQAIDKGGVLSFCGGPQSGKTTLFLRMTSELNRQARFSVLRIDLLQLPPSLDLGKGMRLLVDLLEQAATAVLGEAKAPEWKAAGSALEFSLSRYISALVQSGGKPIVLIFDGIDGLAPHLRFSLFRQVQGLMERQYAAPHCVVFVGVGTGFRYYGPEGQSKTMLPHPPVKSQVLRINPASREQIVELLAQHTEDTGQSFEPAACARIYHLTRGQPWMVNALAQVLVESLDTDPAVAVSADRVAEACRLVIKGDGTHFEAIEAVLNRPAVCKVLSAIISGSLVAGEVRAHELKDVCELGIVEAEPHLHLSNPMYGTLIVRKLTAVIQSNILEGSEWYVKPDGRLDTVGLLRSFQRYYRQHSEAYLKTMDYGSTGNILLALAFLHRTIDDDGIVQQSFQLSANRCDVVIRWKGKQHVIALMRYQDNKTIPEGAEELSRHLAREGEVDGYLLVFDGRPNRGWEEKIHQKVLKSPGGERIHLFGV